MEGATETVTTAEAEQSSTGDTDNRLPWSDDELEQLAAEEDRRLATAQALEARGLDPYPNLITTQDLRARAAKLQPTPDKAS